MLVQAQRTTAKAHTQIARVAREAAAAADDLRSSQISLRKEQVEHAKRLKEHEAWHRRMEVKMEEFNDKLNGLIGYIDNR